MKKLPLILIFFFPFGHTMAQIGSTKEKAEELSGINVSMPELVDYAKNNFTDDLEKARFFFYWISDNIEYDFEVKDRLKAGTNTEEDDNNNLDPLIVFERKKAICEGYSQLFKWFMQELDIETIVIGGYIRNFTNPIVEPDLDKNFKHTWNACKINDEWLIVDTTWAQQFESNVPDFYFDISPEKLIITHFPSESKWQLLEKPLTLVEFNSSQYIDPLYFLSGFTEKPSLKQDESFYYFICKNNPNKNWLIRLGFGTDSLNYEPIPGIKVINQDGYTYYRFEKKLVPAKAAFKVDLNNFNEERQTMILYENIILFRI